jgi:hypothetical protein
LAQKIEEIGYGIKSGLSVGFDFAAWVDFPAGNGVAHAAYVAYRMLELQRSIEDGRTHTRRHFTLFIGPLVQRKSSGSSDGLLKLPV